MRGGGIGHEQGVSYPLTDTTHNCHPEGGFEDKWGDISGGGVLRSFSISFLCAPNCLTIV